jgi:hypothetical protein
MRRKPGYQHHQPGNRGAPEHASEHRGPASGLELLTGIPRKGSFARQRRAFAEGA